MKTLIYWVDLLNSFELTLLCFAIFISLAFSCEKVSNHYQPSLVKHLGWLTYWTSSTLYATEQDVPRWVSSPRSVPEARANQGNQAGLCLTGRALRSFAELCGALRSFAELMESCERFYMDFIGGSRLQGQTLMESQNLTWCGRRSCFCYYISACFQESSAKHAHQTYFNNFTSIKRPKHETIPSNTRQQNLMRLNLVILSSLGTLRF